MADPISRDHIWDVTLSLLEDRDEFRVRDVENELEIETSTRTVRRTLAAMERLGWLEREAPGAHYWKPGPKAEERLG